MFFETVKVSKSADFIKILTAPLNEINEKHRSFFLSSIKEAQKGRNFINFTEKNFPINNQTAVSLALIKNKCVAFSSVWNRKSFWGNSVYRVANRTWYDPSYRVTVLSKKTPNISIIQTMIHQQLRFISEITKEYVAFISREGNKQKYLRWFSQKISVPFYVHSGLYLVCPNRSTLSCWHTIASFQKGGRDLPFEKLKSDICTEKIS